MSANAATGEPEETTPGPNDFWKSVRWTQGQSLANKYRFDQPAHNSFQVAMPECRVLEAGGFIGDTRRGGSCNVHRVTWTPHCHGTHTESVGHIVNEYLPITEVVPLHPIYSRLISVPLTTWQHTKESYRGQKGLDDLLITRESLERGWSQVAALQSTSAGIEMAAESRRPPCRALVVRTGWNQLLAQDEELYRTNAPFFTEQAMQWLVEKRIAHLLVETASVDRLEDGGALVNHRIFWRIEANAQSLNLNTRILATITELIAIPPELPDADYALLLVVTPWKLDAAPSTPMLFPLQ
jgi:kynurenine formamidase